MGFRRLNVKTTEKRRSKSMRGNHDMYVTPYKSSALNSLTDEITNIQTNVRRTELTRTQGTGTVSQSTLILIPTAALCQTINATWNESSLLDYRRLW